MVRHHVGCRFALLSCVGLALTLGASAQDEGKTAKAEAEAETPLLWGPEARVLAASHRVVRGVLHVDVKAVAKAQTKSDYVGVTVEVLEHLVGAVQDKVAFRTFVRPPKDAEAHTDDLSAAQLLALDGQERIVFLGGPGGVYLAGDDDRQAVREPDPEFVARLRRRLRLHAAMLAQPLSIDRRSRARVDKVMRRICRDVDHQRQAFVDLLALDRADLPALIAVMDDRRALLEQSITLQNRARDAFEPFRHYGPKLVVDAVAAVLNQHLGESFGAIYSGGSDTERDACVRGWKVYAHYLARKPR
ncbi:MAG: hypothetical protein KDC98_09475 [Planctomycetes bacterium]|nr:hypothetical protein [Planctomycetota bacterium]